MRRQRGSRWQEGQRAPSRVQVWMFGHPALDTSFLPHKVDLNFVPSIQSDIGTSRGMALTGLPSSRQTLVRYQRQQVAYPLA